MFNAGIASDVYARDRATFQGAVVLIAGVYKGIAETSIAWQRPSAPLIEQGGIGAIDRAHPAVTQLGVAAIVVPKESASHEDDSSSARALTSSNVSACPTRHA